MHPTLRVFSRAHSPLIKFIGKRVWSSTPEAPHAHPAGIPLPAGFSKSAPSSASSPSSGKSIHSEFWEAPDRFWKRELSVDEMSAIDTGGASQW